MATRATIGIYHQDSNTVTYIPSSYDGYQSFTGRCLALHYNTLEKAQKLIEFGDIVHPTENIKDLKRGRFNQEAQTVNFQKFVKNTKSEHDADYMYLFFDGAWHLLNNQPTNKNDGLVIDDEVLNRPTFKNKIFYITEPNGFNQVDIYAGHRCLVENIGGITAYTFVDNLPYQYHEDLPKDWEDADFSKWLDELENKLSSYRKQQPTASIFA